MIGQNHKIQNLVCYLDEWKQYFTGKPGKRHGYFTSNICRSILKVIHDWAKPQNTVPGLLLG